MAKPTVHETKRLSSRKLSRQNLGMTNAARKFAGVNHINAAHTVTGVVAY